MGVLPKQWICLPELTENVRKRVTGGLALTLSLWPSIYVRGPLYSSTIQVNEFFGRVFSSFRILGNPPLLGNLFSFCNFQHFPTVPTKVFQTIVSLPLHRPQRSVFGHHQALQWDRKSLSI